MEDHTYISTGYSLMLGSILIIITMVLHPTGGSIDHIINISPVIIGTHSLAIVSLPFMLFGFYGLTHRLSDRYKLSVLAFIIIAFGLVAVMFAGMVNGLALPFFLGHYAERSAEIESVLKPVMKYSFALNISLDYIFIGACCMAIAIYSVLIVRLKNMPKWIGYLGISIIVVVLVGVVTGFIFTSVAGFRIFIFGLATWIISSGFSLTRTREHE